MGKEAVSCCQNSTEQRGPRYSVHLRGKIDLAHLQKPKQHFSTLNLKQKQGGQMDLSSTQIDPLDNS